MPLPSVLRSEIETDIAGYLGRADLAAYISSFFSFAHLEIQRKQDWACMEVTWNTPFVLNVASYGAPADLKKPGLLYQYNTTTNKIVGFYSQTNIHTLKDKRFQDYLFALLAAAMPGDLLTNLFYAIWNNSIELYPVPSAVPVNVILQLDYWAWMTPPGQNSFDWFTSNTRDYLTYEALCHSAPFVGADPRLITWRAMADKAYRSACAANTDFVNAGELQMRG